MEQALQFKSVQPTLYSNLLTRPWSWPFHALTGVAAVVALAGLARGRYRLARAAAVAQTVLILVGWAAVQSPYLIVPDVTLAASAAHPEVRRLLLIALAAGVPVLGPSLVILFRVFKTAKR